MRAVADATSVLACGQNLDAGRIHSARADKRKRGPQKCEAFLGNELKQKLLELRG